MPDPVNVDFRFLASHDAQHRSALRLVVSGQIVPDQDTDRRVDDLLGFIAAMQLDLEPVLAVYRDDRMHCACAAVITPGRTALLYLPPDRTARRRPSAFEWMLRTVQPALWSRGVVLAQALIPTGSPHTEQTLSATGFRFLAELVYEERPVAAQRRAARIRDDLEFVSYSAESHGLFIDALNRTYEASLDCPALTGLRSTEDVLATHQAAGRHDPALWSVGCANGEPVGVLLLSQVLRRPALEVVYMGVASSARGMGVGDALLARAAEECVAREMTAITLAVDSTNGPALRLYDRWQFNEIARRRAWIITAPSGPL